MEGDKEQALKDWPRLRQYEDQLFFLNKQPGWSWQCIRALKRCLATIQPDYIHSHHIGPLLYGGIAARLNGIRRHIHTEHDAWHLNSRKRRILQRMGLLLAQPVWVADATMVADSMNQARLDYPNQVVHNGVDCDFYRPGKQVKARQESGIGNWLVKHDFDLDCTQVVGCAGRLVIEKGYSFLLEALAQLPCHTVLVVAGRGPEYGNILHIAKQLGVASRLCLLGTLDDMRAFYQSLDVFAMASLKEGLPLSPLEAQACGVPVVLTDVGGCREACCDTTGMLVPAEDGMALATAIRKQLLRAQSGAILQSPRQFVEQNRSLADMVKRYTRLATIEA